MQDSSNAAPAATVAIAASVSPYEFDDRGIHHITRAGDRRQLSNFYCVIGGVIENEHGQAVEYVIDAMLSGQTRTFHVPVSSFESLNWVSTHLGPGAVVMPEPQAKRHVVTAIRLHSRCDRRILLVEHIGWVKVGAQDTYVHSEGTIPHLQGGCEVRAQLPASLASYRLPEPKHDLANDVRASLKLLNCAPLHITTPLFGAVFRAILGRPNLAIWIVGSTGIGKSELAGLTQAFFGSDFSALNLPQSWSSTGNAIQAHLKAATDALTVVDDYLPASLAGAGRGKDASPDIVIRGQTNQQARHRCESNGSLVSSASVQGMVVSTGEDVPRTQSLVARQLVLPLEPASTNWDVVTECQQAAQRGRFAEVTAAFVAWVASPGRRERLHNLLRPIEVRWRSSISGGHARLPANVAAIELGVIAFLLFVRERGFLAPGEGADLLRQCRTALCLVAEQQIEQSENTSPSDHFVGLLRAALSSGRARMEVVENGRTVPPSSGLPSWCGTRNYGRTIGYYEPNRDAIHLDPKPAIAIAMRMASEAGEVFGFTEKTIGKRLDEAHLLLFRDADRNTYKFSVNGQRVRVLSVPASLFFGEDDPPTSPDPIGGPDAPAVVGSPPDREAVDLAKLAGKTGGIEWTGHTWNPGAGCTKVSPGCKNCYANELHDRRHRMFQLAQGIYAANGRSIPKQYSQPFSSIQFFPERLVIPGSVKTPTLFFVNSMTDLFHAGFTTDQIHQVLEVMRSTPRHWYQLLTKRPERLLEACQPGAWPKNLLLGVSVEDKAALKRIRPLVESQPSLAWLSIEPLLEDLGQIDLAGISWVVVGGETAAVGRCRPMHPDWVRSIRDQCVNAKVPLFFKQWGNLIHESQLPGGRAVPSRTTHKWADGTVSYHIDKKTAGRLLDGKKWDQFPLVYKLDESDVQAE